MFHELIDPLDLKIGDLSSQICKALVNGIIVLFNIIMPSCHTILVGYRHFGVGSDLVYRRLHLPGNCIQG